MSSNIRGELVLRVDRCFRVSGSVEEKRIYGLVRTSVERINSKFEFVGLECVKIRDLRNVMVYVVLCVVSALLVAVSALQLGRP